MGNNTGKIKELATANYTAAFIKPYNEALKVEAAIQERLAQLEVIGIKGDVLKHIEQQARATGEAAALVILDGYLNAAKVTKTAALNALLKRLTAE